MTKLWKKLELCRLSTCWTSCLIFRTRLGLTWYVVLMVNSIILFCWIVINIYMMSFLYLLSSTGTNADWNQQSSANKGNQSTIFNFHTQQKADFSLLIPKLWNQKISTLMEEYWSYHCVTMVFCYILLGLH